ncbi:hypothetical protein GX48_06496 [Paracoccidioides brasiliensis]|nr:hypothetical protein GX48_06496 [Paracoccidioides brasiliensis]
MALKLLAEKGSAVPTHLGSIPGSSTKAPRRRIKELMLAIPLIIGGASTKMPVLTTNDSASPRPTALLSPVYCIFSCRKLCWGEGEEGL